MFELFSLNHVIFSWVIFVIHYLKKIYDLLPQNTQLV